MSEREPDDQIAYWASEHPLEGVRNVCAELVERREAERAPKTVQCNCCGRAWDREKEVWEAQETNYFKVHGGYGNRQWGDETLVEWIACQDCLAAWFRTFKVAPSVSDYEIYGWGHARKGPPSPLVLPPDPE